jgi:hypothetical protein
MTSSRVRKYREKVVWRLWVTFYCFQQNVNLDNRSTNGNVTASKPMLPPGAGPNVEAALSNVVEPQPDRKSIIGGRKPAAKKAGVT